MVATPEMQTDSVNTGRIAWLDGCRGLAIAMVVLFHAYAAWPEVVPFGARFSLTPLRLGWVGVQLFFLVSGYVIALTLRSCGGFLEFARRRWMRLFPAMLVVTTLIVATAPWLPERPAGPIHPLQLLPGLTFIEPGWWSRFAGLDNTVLECSFWSLFVEVKFYAVAGCIWFLAGPRAFVPGLAICYAIWLGVESSMVTGPLSSLAHAMSFRWFGWFGAGACIEAAVRRRSHAAMMAGVALGTCSALSERGLGDPAIPIVLALLCVAFATASWNTSRTSYWTPRPMLLLATISYPMYLLHENALVALTIQFGHEYPGSPAWLLPLPPLALLTALSWLVATRAEPATRIALKRAGGRLRRRFPFA